MILVSHDRYLLEACADRLWLVQGGQVTPFDGDLDDYRRHVLADERPRQYRRREIAARGRSGAGAPRRRRQARRDRAAAQARLARPNSRSRS